MSWATSEVVGVLIFLLPGFVAAAVFYSLTPYLKPSEVERVLQALIFTVVGQAILRLAAAVNLPYVKRVLENRDWEIAISLLMGVAIGLAAAYLSNLDIPHRFFRRIGLTRETTYPSEWYSAFSENTSRYVVLHLNDERRLFGWAATWPREPNQGHFDIREAEWLIGDIQSLGESSEIASILVPANEVNMVEFVNERSPIETER